MSLPSPSAWFIMWFLATLPLMAVQPAGKTTSSWPQAYSVQHDDAAGRLILGTPYYQVWHDLKRSGTIAGIRLTHGHATNLLLQPIGTRIQNESGTLFTDLNDTKVRISHRQDDLTEIVTVESRLLDNQGRALDVQLKTVFEYHWGHIKIHKEFTRLTETIRVRELCPVFTILTPSLSDYGYREGTTEREGAPPFSFGSNRWGKLGGHNPTHLPLNTPYVPRSMLFAHAGVEGLEWFVSSDLWQWDLQLTGSRGQGRCLFQVSQDPAGFTLSISPLYRTNTAVILPKTGVFDFYLGIPIIEGHAQKPWFHASFNRNRGQWVAPEQIRRWADTGIQTVHCHNDGDYYDDGLFWRDGSYPPYPDMGNYDQVITNCHQAGIQVATYFSNKELHPTTREFQDHGMEWGRKDSQGKLRHNFYRGTNEFGAQMCLRSGWLEFLKFSIDRVLKRHSLDGVYYDWNVALFCGNGLHEGKKNGEMASGHWDIDELLQLTEWTRRRVGPTGLIIVHNTTTPMFALENFADHVVANEWGYGKWKDPGPELTDLPLEWSLVGARSRGVISYGQLDAQSPQRFHRLFAWEALLSGVTPWPASTETCELFSLLKPLGDIETYRFADWRNQAVILSGNRCASAIYNQFDRAFAVLANLDKNPQEVRCVVHPTKLPYPLASLRSATLVSRVTETEASLDKADNLNLDVGQLTREGIKAIIPADSAVLLQIR